MAICKYLWLTLLIALAAATALWPALDLWVTHAFYVAESFPAKLSPVTVFIHDLATGGLPKIIGAMLIAGIGLSLWRKTSPRPWIFLLLALLLGPGLLANVALKDQWGRARPAQVSEFGGQAPFTPYWQPTTACDTNCSFVSGDGSFGFMLPAVALVLVRRRRLVFWSGIGLGLMFGVTRIMMGAHFLSDTVWAALLMLGTMFALHALLFGCQATRAVWKSL